MTVAQESSEKLPASDVDTAKYGSPATFSSATFLHIGQVGQVEASRPTEERFLFPGSSSGCTDRTPCLSSKLGLLAWSWALRTLSVAISASFQHWFLLRLRKIQDGSIIDLQSRRIYTMGGWLGLADKLGGNRVYDWYTKAHGVAPEHRAIPKYIPCIAWLVS